MEGSTKLGTELTHLGLRFMFIYKCVIDFKYVTKLTVSLALHL